MEFLQFFDVLSLTFKSLTRILSSPVRSPFLLSFPCPSGLELTTSFLDRRERQSESLDLQSCTSWYFLCHDSHYTAPHWTMSSLEQDSCLSWSSWSVHYAWHIVYAQYLMIKGRKEMWNEERSRWGGQTYIHDTTSGQRSTKTRLFRVCWKKKNVFKGGGGQRRDVGFLSNLLNVVERKLAFDEYLTLESTMVLHLQFYKTLICTRETEIQRNWTPCPKSCSQ